MIFRQQIIAACAAALLVPVTTLAADTAPAAKQAVKQEVQAKKPAATCDTVTGTRIRPRKDSGCDSASNRPIRIYSAEELQNTGRTDLADALRSISPIFR